MTDSFDPLRSVGDRARLPLAQEVRRRGDQRTARTRAAMGSAAVAVIGAVGVALATNGSTNQTLRPDPLASSSASSSGSPTPSPTPVLTPTTVPTRTETGPDSEAWWLSQTYPTGWESTDTVTFRDGLMVSCTKSVCGFSLAALDVQPGTATTGATATIMLLQERSEGTIQTILQFVVEADGFRVLRRASDSAVPLAASRLGCEVDLTWRSEREFLQTFSACPDASGNGTVVWNNDDVVLRPK